MIVVLALSFSMCLWLSLIALVEMLVLAPLLKTIL
jgi:hypothetical protein